MATKSKTTDVVDIVREALIKAIESGEISQYRLNKAGIAKQQTLSDFINGSRVRVDLLQNIANAIGLELVVRKLPKSRRPKLD